MKEQLEKDKINIQDNLQKIKNGDFNYLRKNEVGRWIANDILKQGNQYKSYVDLPSRYENLSKADPFGNK